MMLIYYEARVLKCLLRVTLLSLLFSSTFANAGAYSNWAVPTNVELVGGGVLIHGQFGDPNNCGKANFIYVSHSDIRFDSVFSMALAALMGQKELRLYSSSCVGVGFHWPGNVINQNTNGQAVYIR
ncbi:hypothetical protein Swoo_1470 [Shewanella woodyi ATCC 51908]|uniref:Uncharacterized protein n=1 Tax=Shewanella woodyi (strain ATCC 51908 / MS32) TaxID=392500 RepID=B1KKB8_SHEWM|nr:hypothetical protein Swoo_1470 [Shewanella woodyi ATCC 51908]